MIRRRVFLGGLLSLSLGALSGGRAAPTSGKNNAVVPATPEMQKRWLFVWRDMSDPQQVDRTIALFPRAQVAGYNAVVFGAGVALEKAVAFRQAARQHGLGLVAMVMGGSRDRNYAEGLPVQEALFVAQNGTATFWPDNPTQVANGGFEDVTGNHFPGWAFQDDEGVTTFADHTTTHGGGVSLRMQDIGRNAAQHCRIQQTIRLQPHRHYRISVWVRTEGLAGVVPEVKLLTPDGSGAISYQTFHCEPTQDWTHYDLVFNSLDNTSGLLYLGTWSGTGGRIWWDDLSVEEIGLVNVLRRPGCPVVVRAEGGMTYEEGHDYTPIADHLLSPWHAFHDAPSIRLTPNTRIPEGQRLRVSYYHPVLIYQDSVTSCLSEPKIFDDWKAEVEKADKLYHPDAFLMQHDELRVINQCAACRAKNMTPGELLAWNVHKAAGIIRAVRPDAGIWVWSDMFDPDHNAVDHYYLVNGTLKGSWQGLDPGIGIMNWNGGALGKDCPFFAGLGLRQILSGYYDGDADGTTITRWKAAVQTVPGIVGAMYTTWADNYDSLESWAKKAWPKTPTSP
jgi:hypothetical protein